MLATKIKNLSEYIFNGEFKRDIIIHHSLHLKYVKSENLPTKTTTPPEKIEYISTLPKSKFPVTDEKYNKSNISIDGPVCGILGGHWDLYKQNWFEDEVSENVRQFLQKYSITIQSGDAVNNECLEEREKDLVRLYNSMEKTGYEIDPQNKVDIPTSSDRTTHTINDIEYPDICQVGIGRNGEIIRFHVARNRISIAKIIGLESIPILVVIRHSKWQAIRQKFEKANSLSDIPKTYRNYKNHPDIPKI